MLIYVVTENGAMLDAYKNMRKCAVTACELAHGEVVDSVVERVERELGTGEGAVSKLGEDVTIECLTLRD